MAMKLTGELDFFKSQPVNIRTLLVTNLLFAIVLPIIEIFAGAYIMRNTGSSSYVMMYQLCMYIGIVITAIANGLLLKRFKVTQLYSFGILISAVSLMVMMFISNVTIGMLCGTGLMLGLSTGFFWTNRYLLTLYSTDDENRNYFFGFESFFFSFWNIVVPVIAGAFLANIEGAEFLDRILTVNNGYQIMTVFAFLVSMAACIALSKGKFKNPESKNFFYFRFHRLWNKMLTLAGLKGMVQGFLVTAPAILIMKFIGGEGSLGLIQGIGGAVTAILVYILGRIARPQDRLKIFGMGLLVFFLGTLCNCILFSAAGVIVFILSKVLFQPLHDLAYYPIMMRTIDTVSSIENRDGYAYIMTHEVGLFAGRAFGMILFILMATLATEEIALRYAILIVGSLQLLSIPLASSILREIDNNDKK